MTRSGYGQPISSHHLIHHITSQLSEPYLKFTKHFIFCLSDVPSPVQLYEQFPGCRFNLKSAAAVQTSNITTRFHRKLGFENIKYKASTTPRGVCRIL